MGLARELEVAGAAVRSAATAIHEARARGLELSLKGGREVVTNADREANRLIRSTLLDAFPGDVIYSEEDPDPPARHGARRVWIIDPLDGTGSFTRGENEHGVSVGLAIDGRAVVGAVYSAARDALYHGAVGMGAWRDAEPVTVTRHASPATATILMSRKELSRNDAAGRSASRPPWRVHPLGSTACKLALVAAGEADGVVSYKARREWGSCAGTALVLAAGGIVTDLSGAALTFNRPASQPTSQGLVAAGPELHQALLAQASRPAV